MEVGNLKFTWTLKNFSKLQNQCLSSDVSSLGSYKWKMRAYPKGYYVENYLAIFLEVADSETLPSGWSRKAKFSFTVINQFNDNSSYMGVLEHEFTANDIGWGYTDFISYEELYDPNKGYLVQDTCIIEADVTIYDDPTKEDMEAFFRDLNSMIFPKKVVSAEEEAKEGLAVIEEALNMVLADLNNPSRKSQLTNAFDVLSSLEYSSVLTSEQKVELLNMKDNLIALPERAAKATEKIQQLDQEEISKKTIDQKLVRCLVEFEKAKAETAQNKRDIGHLEHQIGVKKQKMQDLSSKQKEMFRLSKELKAELDVLVKNFSENEATRKSAEEEEKVVGAEWSKMKQFFSSLKKQS